MRRAALAALLLAAAPAARAAETPAHDAFYRLRTSTEADVRAAACAELSTAPYRGAEAERTLALAMSADLSERVRLAAAMARASYFDADAVPVMEKFFAKEPDERVRAELTAALAAAPAQALNPDVTRLLGDLLSGDTAPAVRKAAAAALLTRQDARILPWLTLSAKADPDPAVRAAAADAARAVAARPPPPKPKKQKAKEPDPDGVKGKDPCPLPWAWCDCGGPVPTRSHCIRRDECVRKYLDSYKPLGMSCSWNGFDVTAGDATPGD